MNKSDIIDILPIELTPDEKKDKKAIVKKNADGAEELRKSRRNNIQKVRYKDFDYLRGESYELYQKAKKCGELAFDAAQEINDPEEYRKAALTLGKAQEILGKTLEYHEMLERIEYKKFDGKGTDVNITNNTMNMTGTTNDLLKMIESANNKAEESK